MKRSACLILFGVVITVLFSPDITWFGVLISTTAVVCTAYIGLVQSERTSRLGLTPLQLMYIDSPVLLFVQDLIVP